MNAEPAGVEPVPRLNYRVEEAATALGIGRTSAYELIKLGRMKAFKYGRLTRITRDEVLRVAREMAAA